ncbi:alcohol dehydrogenase catalytic domain-containing protein [Burkholderia gladioli]|uniref:alcohol dehydrogenase catalytic domain-containing protein n=1 Tax=Burkholderia gladioli TaxID=28095 RepID=UPI003B97EEC9
MKAARLTAYGDPVAGIVLHDVPEPPALAPDEVLVQMRYAPINVSDLMVARGVYDWRPSLPEVLGNEGSGVVVATGRDVAGYMPGASVVLPFMARTWRERLVAKAEQLTRVPVGVDLRQAAMATINLVTAAMLLDDYVELSPGDAIVYNAANSGLGHCLAGLASRRDIRTIGLVRRQEDVERVRQSGCEIVWLDQDQACADQAGLAGMAVKLALDGWAGLRRDGSPACFLLKGHWLPMARRAIGPWKSRPSTLFSSGFRCMGSSRDDRRTCPGFAIRSYRCSTPWPRMVFVSRWPRSIRSRA